MKRFETIEKIPTWALCYIINGDPTGLSDEDIKMVDGFMQKWQVEIVSPLSQDGNASFSHYPAFGLPAEVEECKVIYHTQQTKPMYEYDEFTDIVGCSCTLLIPYKGRTEGYVVADYGNDIVVKLHNGKEIVERRDDVLVYD